MQQPSVNALSAPLVKLLSDQAAALRVGVARHESGAQMIDAGIQSSGGLEAGRLIAEVCMGGLGQVRLAMHAGAWPIEVQVHSTHPVLACLASQYAGWSLAHGEGKGAFNALASGPGRALARRETLFQELNYSDRAEATVLVLEVNQAPPQEIVDKVARDCALPHAALSFILTPTTSLAGCVQIVARVLEVALHKAHALHFPLEKIVDGAGSAPLPPPSPDFLTAMGRTNDAILFGGTVQLYVRASDEEARELAAKLPSSASSAYGKPFAQIFKEVNYDFYRIDAHLFAPAHVVVTNLASGNTFRGGELNHALLRTSFGG